MSPDEAAVQPPQERSIARRSVLRGLGAGALATAAGGVLAACSSGSEGSSASSSTGTINIGYIAPFTGAISGFASGDRFVIDTIRGTSAYARGIKAGGRTYQVNIIVTDSQSDPNRASSLARQLILNNNVDMLLVSSTPETVNPAAVVAQTQGVPCVGTNDPWESWYAGLGGDPTKATTAFQYCTLFFFGLKDLNDCFVPMWNSTGAHPRNVALQYPNDADGNAFRAALPAMMLAETPQYTPIDGGAYTDGTTDFTPMITKFKQTDCQYLSNCPLPPDFNRFWRQANQQGWKPRLATVAKVLLFPADTVALGPLVNNIATDSWWGPYMPYKSSLDPKLRAQDLVNDFQAQTGRQWVQSIGGTYTLFEIAHRAFTSVSDPHDRQEVADAIHKVNYTGMSGHLNFRGGPAPGVAITPLAGVQWKATTNGSKFPFEMRVVDNTNNPLARIGAHLEPTNPA
ncbi:MAG TPA: ABC transporter substrate-binding protein [Streptosporangiaceae bacterium]|jgi:branched-chain amino acid transport system substrate-binding protein